MDDTQTAKARRVLTDVLCVDEDTVVPEAKLVDDLGADSLDAVELALDLEAEFAGVDIDQGEFDQLVTVGDVYAMLDTKLAAVA